MKFEIPEAVLPKHQNIWDISIPRLHLLGNGLNRSPYRFTCYSINIFKLTNIHNLYILYINSNFLYIYSHEFDDTF